MLPGRQQGQDGEGPEYVKAADGQATDPGGAADGSLRIADLAAHDGAEFQPAEGERDLRPEVQVVPVPFGHHADGCRSTVPQERHQAGKDDDDSGNARRHGSKVLVPFADLEADEVRNQGDPQSGNRHRDNQDPAVGQRLIARKQRVKRHADAGQQQIGKEEQVTEPVAPAAQEAMPLAKADARPGIDATLLRELGSQASDCPCQRHEEEDCGAGPQAERTGTDVSGRGEPADADDRCNVEEDHVPQAEFTTQCGRRIRHFLHANNGGRHSSGNIRRAGTHGLNSAAKRLATGAWGWHKQPAHNSVRVTGYSM